MKSTYKKSIPAFGLLLLSGAIAFPNLSDAMQLSINTDLEDRYEMSDDKFDKELKKEIRSDIKIEKQSFKEEREFATTTSKHEYRPNVFGRIWSSIVHRDKDRNENTSALFLSHIKLETESTNAQITWSTNHAALATLTYSMSEDLRNSTTITLDANTKQSVEIKNLQANTTYFYKITSTSSLDNDNVLVKNGSFTTEKNTDEATEEGGPKLLWIRTSLVASSSANIVWFTPTKSSSKVWIESDTDVNTTIAPAYTNTSLSFFHTVRAEDLEANTTYHFKVASTDKTGKTTISTLHSFTTKVE